MMLLAILIVLNVPVYLFLAWIVFDTASNAADSLFDTLVALLKIILVPRIARVMLGWDDTDAIGILPVAGFLAACGALVYGEYLLVQKWL